MVADSHPMANPPKTTKKVWRLSGEASNETSSSSTAYTIPTAML